MHDDHVFRVNGLPTPTWPGSEVLEINGTAADMARHYGHNEVGLEMGVSGSAPHWKEINTHLNSRWRMLIFRVQLMSLEYN